MVTFGAPFGERHEIAVNGETLHVFVAQDTVNEITKDADGKDIVMQSSHWRVPQAEQTKIRVAVKEQVPADVIRREPGIDQDRLFIEHYDPKS